MKNESYIGTIVHEANKAKEEQLESLNQIEEKYKEMLNIRDGTILGLSKSFEKNQNDRFNELKEYKVYFNNFKEETIKSIKDFEKSHKESINLKESKKYWYWKSWKHTSFAIFYFVLFIAIILAPFIVSISDFVKIFDNTVITFDNTIIVKMINHFEKLKGLYQFSIYGVYILGVSIWLWIARIILKISLSNRHLSEDANEKETMINTYLALTREGQMGENNQKIILETIFRHTVNGIIKDDSAVTLLDLVKAIKK